MGSSLYFILAVINSLTFSRLSSPKYPNYIAPLCKSHGHDTFGDRSEAREEVSSRLLTGVGRLATAVLALTLLRPPQRKNTHSGIGFVYAHQGSGLESRAVVLKHFKNYILDRSRHDVLGPKLDDARAF